MHYVERHHVQCVLWTERTSSGYGIRGVTDLKIKALNKRNTINEIRQLSLQMVKNSIENKNKYKKILKKLKTECKNVKLNKINVLSLVYSL